MLEKFSYDPNKSHPSQLEKTQKDSITRRNFIKKSLKGLAGFVLATQLPIDISGKEENVTIESEESFDIERIKEQIQHISGSTWELQSVAQNGEYYPSFNNSLFYKKEMLTSPEISGSFKKDLKIFNRFGTFAETVSDINIENLLLKYKNNIQINDSLIVLLKHLAQDSYVFIALSQFFEDGGKFKFGRGYYSPKPLEIEFGNHENPTQNEATLYHELLHYIFDKEDSTLFESHDYGGADHAAISPLEERFNIIQAIDQGEVPFGKNISNLYGFTAEGKAGDKIKQFLKSNDLQGLNSYLLSNDFFKNYIHSGMVSPLSSVEHKKNHRDFRLKLSDGSTLRISEDYTLKDSSSINKVEYGGIYGVFIDVEVKDIKDFNTELLDSYILSSDIQSVEKFLDEHKNNDSLNRGYILTLDQIHDIAYLNSCNAIILENSFIIAIEYSKKNNIPFEKVFSEEAYKEVFQEFINQFTLLEQHKKSHFPAREKAGNITQKLIQKIY